MGGSGDRYMGSCHMCFPMASFRRDTGVRTSREQDMQAVRQTGSIMRSSLLPCTLSRLSSTSQKSGASLCTHRPADGKVYSEDAQG